MSGPCSGLAVVEVSVGVSELGLGLAGGVPGMILADLGADVTRVVGSSPAIDDYLQWGRVWHRDKHTVVAEDPDEIGELLNDADVAIVYGSEALVEQRGLGWSEACAGNPSLVYARCRPSRTSAGGIPDYGLLVEARAGFCTQLAGHRPGPIFVDVRAPGSGAAFVITASVLALLHRRALSDRGGWAETSLYDGMLATLGCMIGRSERAAPEIEKYWEKGSWFPNFLYRCADGELIQVWFGGKGMYDNLIEVLGDESSVDGYYADQAAGRLGDRAIRWRSIFATQRREVWLQRLRDAGVACEAVLGPGEALGDPHLSEIGLAVALTENGHDDVVVATPLSVEPFGDDHPIGSLDGVRVVDFSAFVAGPLAAEVLADLGATVVKVEPPQGEAMRGAAYAMAACQRGKRSLAMDINAAEARPVVERLVRWADVVLHNFRVGVSERLGIDEATVARINPRAVYCHASAFGGFGPRAKNPGNDALMQALTGFEQAVGGAGNDPIGATWIPVDMSGGWMGAIGILAGLYSRALTGRGQSVATSLLGAGMLLQSGVFLRDGEVERGPELDAAQTGYGPGYRIYEGSDGKWFALVVPDAEAWERLNSVVSLPTVFAPLRLGPWEQPALSAESVLTSAFAGAPASHWISHLTAAGMLVEPVAEMNRDEFRRSILDDPVNRQLARVAAFETEDWGHFEQIGSLIRYGPEPINDPLLILPGIGEHTVEILRELGVPSAEIDRLLASKVACQGSGITPKRHDS